MNKFDSHCKTSWWWGIQLGRRPCAKLAVVCLLLMFCINYYVGARKICTLVTFVYRDPVKERRMQRMRDCRADQGDQGEINAAVAVWGGWRIIASAAAVLEIGI
jgi:hypothetical protein